MCFFNFLLFPIKKMISPLFIGPGSAILLGSALSAGVSAVNSWLNKRNNDKTYDYQRNAYRYTAEDMARAGLSPALLASGSASATSSPSLSSPDLGGLGSAIQTAMQVKSNQSIAEKNNETSKSINDANLSASAEIRKKDAELKEAQKEQIEAQRRQIEAQRKQIEAQTNDILYETDYKKTHKISSVSSDKWRSAMEFIKPVSDAGKKLVDSLDKINEVAPVSNSVEENRKRFPTLKSYFNELERDGSFRVNKLTREEQHQLIQHYRKLVGKDK